MLKTIRISWSSIPPALLSLLPLPLPNLQNSNKRFEIAPTMKLKLPKSSKYSARKALADWLTIFLNGKNLTDSFTTKRNYISSITRSSMPRSSRPAMICPLLGISANMECLSLSHVITGGLRWVHQWSSTFLDATSTNATSPHNIQTLRSNLTKCQLRSGNTLVLT
jgi:hypothetical protein